jgi:chromosome segregation ATPase
VQNSLDGIEEELARTERKIAALRETLRRSHGESSAHDAALHEMGLRAKEIMSRPKTWRGGSKSSDAAELEGLRAEMRARTDAMNRSLEAMKSVSAEATELSKRQQDLSKMRADLVARQGQGDSRPLSTEGRVPPAAPVPKQVREPAPAPPPPRLEGGRSRRRPE